MNTLLILFFLHGGDHGRHCGTVVGFIFSVVTPGYGVLARMLYSTVVCNVHLVHCDSCWRKWCQNSCWRQRADEAFVFEGCVRVRRVWHSKDFFLFNGASSLVAACAGCSFNWCLNVALSSGLLHVKLFRVFSQSLDSVICERFAAARVCFQPTLGQGATSWALQQLTFGR